MIITAVQIKRLLDTGTRLKAIADITLDDMLVVHEIKILQNGEELSIGMPSKPKKPTGFQDIVHPINSDTRQAFENIIFSVYNTALQNNKILIRVRMNYKLSDNVLTQKQDDFELNNFAEPEGKRKQFKNHQVKNKEREDINKSTSEDFYKWLNLI